VIWEQNCLAFQIRRFASRNINPPSNPDDPIVNLEADQLPVSLVPSINGVTIPVRGNAVSRLEKRCSCSNAYLVLSRCIGSSRRGSDVIRKPTQVSDSGRSGFEHFLSATD
jgi:hypothetical protein